MLFVVLSYIYFPYEGGAIRVPHVLSGFPDNLYSKVAPRYKSDQSIQVPSIFFPSRLKEWIYSFFSSPPLIITSPSGKCKTILRNTGLFTEKPPTLETNRYWQRHTMLPSILNRRCPANRSHGYYIVRSVYAGSLVAPYKEPPPNYKSKGFGN